MQPTPTLYQRRVLWNALTGIAMCTIGALAVGLVMLGTSVVAFLQPVLIPIAVAGIIAYLLEPIVVLLTRRRISRAKAVILVFLGFFLFIAGTALFIVPRTYVQASNLLSQRDRIYENVKTRVLGFVEDQQDGPLQEWVVRKADAAGVTHPSKAEVWLESNAGRIASAVWGITASGFRGVSSIVGFTIGLFLIPIYLWFFLIEGKAIEDNWEKFLPLRASRFKREFVDVLKEINSYLIAFFRGQMMVSCIDGVLVGIALSVFGLPYALLIGVFVALLGLMPYVGSLLCWIPAVLISIAHFAVPENQHLWLGTMSSKVWIYPVIVTLIFVGVQQINSFVTAPKIVGDSVGLHPMTVIFSVFFWTLLLGGALGTLLAVPLTAAVKVLFQRYIWDKKLRGPAAPPPADPTAADPPDDAAVACPPEAG